MNSKEASTKIRLLLIASTAEDAQVFQEMLRGNQPCYEVLEACTLAAACQHEAEAFDLVLANLDLPDCIGLETFSRCAVRWPTAPIVVVSDLADEEAAQDAVRAGAQDYLVKGHINSRALRRALHHAIERHRVFAERNLMVRELEQGRKLQAVGQLAAGIAHEINTPTQYVSDNTRFLEGVVADVVKVLEGVRRYVKDGRPAPAEELAALLEDADAEYFLEEVPRAISQSLMGLSHIARIVRAMKEFSHPANNDKTVTDLNAALETTITVASNEWKYVASVETCLDPSLPAVECLPGEINQVFLNLIVNAAHSIADVRDETSHAKGVITVSTSVVNETTVEVRIRDTGSGIAQEHRGKLFEPFFTTKGVGRGTGQGLAIAYDVIVNKHGGRISFDTAVGTGTTFIVQIPIRSAPVDLAA